MNVQKTTDRRERRKQVRDMYDAMEESVSMNDCMYA